MENTIIPYSWGDLADALSRRRSNGDFPPFLVKAEIYWDSLTLFIDGLENKTATLDWLKLLFPLRVSENILTLDGPSFSESIPLNLEVLDKEEYELLPHDLPAQYVAASSQIWFKRKQVDFPPCDNETCVFAFHSVKGGVGRTTSAISFATSLAQKRGRKPLLVDADFEAPGISYLYHDDGLETYVSLEDLLVLAHAEPSERAEATASFVANKLFNQVKEGITILPCLRSAEMLSAFYVRPEQLQKSRSDQPFFLVELLRDVAKLCGCDCVIIDLRAGFTDIAAMVLCAPGVSQVFVTVPSGQAIFSTANMLRFIGNETLRSRSCESRPAVIVNNVISQVRRSAEFAKNLQLLEEAATSFVADTAAVVEKDIMELTSDDVSGAPIVVLDHAPSLTAAPSNLTDFLSDLQGQACFDQLYEGVKEWADVCFSQMDNAPIDALLSPPLSITSPIRSLRLNRQDLQKFARERVYAESNDFNADDFLKIRALTALGNRFKTELPNATCIGMKGAGKTFTFRLLCQNLTWLQFVQGLSLKEQTSATIDAEIIPILPARSLQQLPFFGDRRIAVASMLGGGKPIAFSRLNARIDEAAETINGETAWGDFWLDVMAWSCGIHVESEHAGKQLIGRVIDSKIRIVCLFDGLEESFQTFRTNARQQSAIRGLTSALSQQLAELPGRPIGQINFVRSDLVVAAYPNNSRQFADRNRSFALTWYEEDILDLAAWLAERAGVVAPGHHLDQSLKLDRVLLALWGRKLGKADDLAKEGRTREPRSTEWVLAALSDLRGRLTARDLVGFIASSAELSVSDQSALYSDRLLVPRAMTSAITPVGTEKINAMAEENPGLKPIIETLRKAPQFSVPVSVEEFRSRISAISDEEIKMLQENGIILIENESIEMPEIFRTGLGNVVRAKGGRRSIIGLMNKARKFRSLDNTV